MGIDNSQLSIKDTKNNIKKRNNNKIYTFKEEASNINNIKKKLANKGIGKEHSIVFCFWFILHEINNGNKEFLKKYLNQFKAHFPKSSILLCEINKVNSKILVDNKINTVMPEFFYFHQISNQKIMKKEDVKKNIVNSNYKITDELNFDFYEKEKKKNPSIFIYLLD